MIRQLTKCIREYKAPTIWTLVLILAEVAIDVIIPFETANLINEVKAGAELDGIVRVGLVLVLLAMISLVCGGAAGLYPEEVSGFEDRGVEVAQGPVRCAAAAVRDQRWAGIKRSFGA